MKNKNPLNEYGMTPGAPTPVSAQRTGSMQQSASPNAGGAQKRPPVSQSPSKLKPASPSTATPVSPTAKRGTLDKEPALISLKAQDVPVNSVVKNKAGKVVGTVVEPIQKTPNTPLPPGKPGGPKSDAVVIKDPRGKYKVVKGRDALIVDDPRVQQESVTKAKLTLENIVTVNNRNYGNSMRLAHIDQLPLEEQLSLLDKIDNDKLNEAWGMLNEGLRNPKDNPCWKGYKPVGTKKKNGRTVPNCVPKESIDEAFDTPYPYRWEPMGAREDYHVAYTELEDGTPLEITFERDALDDAYEVEFYRNYSRKVSGMGDAQGVFATVLAVIKDFIQRVNPETITFGAVKEDPSAKITSRTKLYDRMVAKYASQLGYNVETDRTSKFAVYYTLNRTKSDASDGLTEAFDSPYPYVWDNEEKDDGNWDATTRLPDGTPLHIMFSDDGDEVSLEFYRSNDQSVTGEGDAYRVFATVMAATSEYIKANNPEKITFTAAKEDSDEKGSESRAKLYNRMVTRYAAQMGYTAYIVDDDYGIHYTMVRKTPAVQESLTEGAVPNNDKVRTINKLLSRPFPASDIKGQMDAFFAIPDPSMIKAFRQARAEKGDNTSLHPVLRTFIKTLHPAIQKGIKLYEQPRKGPQ